MSNLFKYTKRVLTSVLAAAVVLTAIPSTAFGAELDEDLAIEVQDTEVAEAGEEVVEAEETEDAFAVDGASEDEVIIEGEEENPDRTAKDTDLIFGVYNTSTAKGAGSGSTKNSMDPQNLVIGDFYAANYAPLYAGNGDGDGSGESATKTIEWDHDDDYNFYVSPVAGYELPTTGDTSIKNTITISFVENAGKATLTPGSDEEKAATVKAVEGTDFTVSDPDTNDRVLVTVKASFLKKAFDGRSTTYVAAHQPADVKVAVTTVATGKKFKFSQPTVKGEGGLVSLGQGLLTAQYNTDYKLDVKGNRDAASKQADAKIKTVYLTVKAEGEETKLPVKAISGAAASTKPFSDGDWSGITTGEETALSSDGVFAVEKSVVNKLISGEYTDPVITVEFGEEESTDIAVKFADSNIADIANFHVTFATGASATKVTKETKIPVAFKGKDGRAIESIGYQLDDGPITFVDPVRGTNVSEESTNTWTKNYDCTGATPLNTEVPKDWYAIAIPAAKMVGSELTLSVITAEPATFTFTKNTGSKADVSVEIDGALVVTGAVTAADVTLAATNEHAPLTNEAYSFKVTPVTNKTVTKVAYKLGTAAEQTLTAADDGVTYTIPKDVINSALTVNITAEASTSSDKYDVVKDASTASTIKDMSGEKTIDTTTGGANLATSGEYFYFKATKSNTDKKVTKVEYTDAGATDPTKKNEALEIARDDTLGVVTYRTITKTAGKLTLYGTEATAVSVTKPVNDMVEFVGELTPETNKEYKFTVKPVQGNQGVTKITKVTYVISGTPTVVFNNAAGTDSAAGVSATINASSMTAAVTVYVDTKVVVDKSKYTTTFKEDYPDTLRWYDRPGLTKDAAGNYTLTLANGEEKEFGNVGSTGKLSAVIKNTAGQTVATVITNPGNPSWTAAKTAATEKVVDIDSSKITGNRKSTITDKNDVITVTYQDADTTTGDSNNHNYFEYTAPLIVTVTDRFSSVKLLSANNIYEGSEGFLVKASGQSETFRLYGVNGRTGDDEWVAVTDMYDTKDATKTYVAWTVSPDYNNKTAQAYRWALSGGTDDKDATYVTLTRPSAAEADTPSARVTSTLKDKWGIEYPAAVGAMTLIDDPIDYVILPTVTRANSIAQRGYDQDSVAAIQLESDSSINSVRTSLEVFQQAKTTVASEDKIVPAPVVNATSAENVEKTVSAGNYNVVPAANVTVTWDVYDYVYDHNGNSANPIDSAAALYLDGGVWKVDSGTNETTDRKYFTKAWIDPDEETDKYATVSGSGLSWTVTAVKGASHSGTYTKGNVFATGFEPTFKIGDITLGSGTYGATSLGLTDCSLIVTVGGRIAKAATTLYINDHVVEDKSGATPHTKAQAFKKSYLDTLGVYSIVTSEVGSAGAEVDGYNVGITLPETSAGTTFTLPGMDDIDPANVGAGRAIYGWTDGTNYFDCGEDVPAGAAYYAVWGPKYVVNTIYNGNLVTKDAEGKDDYTNANRKQSDSYSGTETTPTYTLIYDTEKASIPVGLEVNEVVGIISTKDSSANKGKPEYAKEAIHTTTAVALTETTTGGNVLNATKLAAGTIQFASKDTATLKASYKVGEVEYPWAVKYTAAVPTTAGSGAKAEYWMGIDTTATVLTVTPDDSAKQYYVTLSDLEAMKAGTEGQEVTATLYEKKTTPPDTAVAGFGDASTKAGKYEWKSSNESVIKVTQGAAGSLHKATLRPLAPGTSKVTFTYTDPSGLVYSKDVDVTVGGAAAFIKFADSKGKVVADPEFLEDKKAGSGKDYYVMAVTSETATDASSAIPTATFSNSAVTSPLASVAFAGTTTPGLYKMKVTGADAFAKTTFDVKATVGTDVYAKEMTFKTYSNLTINNKVYLKGDPYTAAQDGSSGDLAADILLDGEVQYADEAKTTKLTSITVPYYSTDLAKTATATAGNFDWVWTVDVSRYAKQFAGYDFAGFYTNTSASGKNVGFANASKTSLVWETKNASSDSAAIKNGGDVALFAGFEEGAITNVSGIPSATVTLSDSKTTGDDATTIANFELGITPYDTVKKVYAIADDTNLLVFKTTGSAKITAAESYKAAGSLAGTVTADQGFIPAATPSSKIRTDILGIGIIKGVGGKTTVHLTNGLAGDKKVEYGSFKVTVSGAKYDGANIVGYYDENGELLKNTSKVIGDKTYYFGDDGKTVTNGIVNIDGKLVLIAGGVKETAVGLHDLAGKTYCIKADGTLAKGGLETVSGKQYLFREDGTMVKHTDADVIGGKISVPAIGGPVYVIADDDTAQLDDILYNPQVTWVAKFPSKWDKKDAIPVVAYQVTVTSANTGKTKTTDSTVAEVTPKTVASDATEVTFVATADLSAYFQDKAGTKKAENVTITKTYKFPKGGEQGSAGQDVDPEGDITIEDLNDSYPWTGKQIKPAFKVYDNVNGRYLAQGVDYTVKYGKNKDAGQGTVTITGKGNYAKTGADATFTIVKEAAPEDPAGQVNGFDKIAQQTYTGSPIYPDEIVVKLKDKTTVTMEHKGDGVYGNKAIGGKELLVVVTNNVNKGSATVAATGSNGVTKTTTFKINAKSMEGANATGTLGNPFEVSIDESVDYRIKNTTPEVSIKYNGDELVEGQDFTVKVDTKKGKVTVSGKNNFNKKFEQALTVNPLDLSTCKLVAVTAYEGLKYTAVKATVLDPDGNLVPAGKYTLNVTPDDDAVGSNGKLIGGKNIKVVAKAKGNDSLITGETSEEDFTVAKNFGKASIKVTGSVVYTGEAIELDDDWVNTNVTVKYSGSVIKCGDDFEIVGYTNNVKKGTMTVYCAGKGGFSGTKNFKVKITAKPLGTK